MKQTFCRILLISTVTVNLSEAGTLSPVYDIILTLSGFITGVADLPANCWRNKELIETGY